MASTIKKGNRVEYSTFVSWGKNSIISCEKKEENGRIYAVKVWCKLCAKHKSKINNQLKGSAKINAKSFIDGTTSVTKYQVSLFFVTDCNSLGNSKEFLEGITRK